MHAKRLSSRHLSAKPKPSADEQRVLDHVYEALQSMRFGTITLIVQDGVVVQVERTEKVRVRSTTTVVSEQKKETASDGNSEAVSRNHRS